jgi:hypothetical protein
LGVQPTSKKNAVNVSGTYQKLDEKIQKVHDAGQSVLYAWINLVEEIDGDKGKRKRAYEQGIDSGDLSKAGKIVQAMNEDDDYKLAVNAGEYRSLPKAYIDAKKIIGTDARGNREQTKKPAGDAKKVFLAMSKAERKAFLAWAVANA